MRRVTSVATMIVGFSLAMTTDIEATHRTRTYKVFAEAIGGGTLTDCFRFNTLSSGDLSSDLLEHPLIYRHGNLDTALSRFKAVTRNDAAFEIMYFGRFIPRDDQNPPRIIGEAINEFGTTFVFSGVRDEACNISNKNFLPSGSWGE